MARTNLKRASTLRTHEGAPAKTVSYELQLRRAVLSTMLWEDQYYESGKQIADRIIELIPKVKPEQAVEVAITARQMGNLRHVPLFVGASLARGTVEQRAHVRALLPQIIQRPDELCEIVSLYWEDGKKPLTAGLKKGLADSFTKFDEYQLAKYDRDAPIKLRDVLFLCHAKPRDGVKGYTKEARKQGRQPMTPGSELFQRIATRTLKTPDTWEASLSKGEGKKTEAQKAVEWHRLISEKRLGGMAILRNLRNMEQAGVSKKDIRQAILEGNYKRVLPFRFISAAKYAPDYEPELEKVFLDRFKQIDQLKGQTCVLVDVSGSMEGKISGDSTVDRVMVANGIAMILREMCEDGKIITFSSKVVGVPPRRGFALADAIQQSQSHNMTRMGAAVEFANKFKPERIVAITDEQSHDHVPDPYARGYIVNVASYKNGVGYGKWNHIDGFSAAVCDWIYEFEKL